MPVTPSVRLLGPEALRDALALRDLSNPTDGPHAMQALLDGIVDALRAAWRCPVILWRPGPLTTVDDNYDRLRYPPSGVARDARYTRYVTERVLLRTHTTAGVPPVLRVLAAAGVDDVLVACPGLVYRRDSIDRLHTGEPHQLDLWRVRRGPLGARDLEAMVDTVVRAALPGAAHRLTAAQHPYTDEGQQIDVARDGDWVEVGECGLASPAVLQDAGLVADVTGLAMGLGLDRLLMLRKDIDDIRLLRSNDPRIAGQMLNLEPYVPVSRQPPVSRDLSIAVTAGVDGETLGDLVRSALGPRAQSVEEIAIVAQTAYDALPPQAIERLGMSPAHKNVLLRVVLRHPERSLTHAEANRLRDDIYALVHEGSRSTWAATGPQGKGRERD